MAAKWRKFLLFAIVCFSTPAGYSQPVVALGGVVNAASYANRGLLSSGIAQGSIFTVFGNGLGPDTLVSVSSFPLLPVLGGVSVRVISGGTGVDAMLLYASARQIGAILPSQTPLGPAMLTVSYNGKSSAPEPIIVARRKFGIFTLNQAGTGQAVIQNFNAADDQPFNTLLNPAHPGQTVTLWGTGLGPVSGDEAKGPLPGDLGASIEVRVGDRVAPMRYQGRSGCCAGVDQIVFDVPAGVEGCYVPVAVVSLGPTTSNVVPPEGPVSNFGTMAISSTSRCSDPSGLSAEELLRIQQQPAGAKIGVISLNRDFPLFSLAAQTTDSAKASFARYDLAQLLAAHGIPGLPATGTCLGVPVDAQTGELLDPIRPQLLDAGPVINLNGPKGTKQLARLASGMYSARLGGASTESVQPDFLDPGTYRFDNGSGGSDVGAFQATLNVPVPVNWTNKNIAAFKTPSPTFTWTGGDPNGFVTLYSLGFNNFSGFVTVCTEMANRGTFTIPRYAYAIQGVGSNFGSLPNIVSIGSFLPASRFTAPGLDVGLLTSIVYVPGLYIQ